MNYRERHRVDWDEELRKTEQIRRRGFFISALSFGVAALFIFGLSRGGAGFADVSRKFVFALCLVLSMLVVRILSRRKERLKREREEQIIAQMQKSGKTEG